MALHLRILKNDIWKFCNETNHAKILMTFWKLATFRTILFQSISWMLKVRNSVFSFTPNQQRKMAKCNTNLANYIAELLRNGILNSVIKQITKIETKWNANWLVFILFCCKQWKMTKFKTILINCTVKSLRKLTFHLLVVLTRKSILTSVLNNMGLRLFILSVTSSTFKFLYLITIYFFGSSCENLMVYQDNILKWNIF